MSDIAEHVADLFRKQGHEPPAITDDIIATVAARTLALAVPGLVERVVVKLGADADAAAGLKDIMRHLMAASLREALATVGITAADEEALPDLPWIE